MRRAFSSRIMAIILIAELVCGSILWQATAQEPLRAKQAPAEPKTFTFEMRGKPWAAVFEWLTDKTGVPLVSPNVPSGTFNFIAKKDQKFTIPQIIDIINDGLSLQNYILINRRTSFAIISADLEVRPSWAPRIPLEELGEHGKTEIVSTVVKLKALAAEETAGDVKKQMGSFGAVVPLKQMNSLILQDTVGNLENILAVIREGEQAGVVQNQGNTQIFNVERGNAAALAELIKRMMPPGSVHINPPGGGVKGKD